MQAKNTMKITPKIGINNLKFGMSRNEVIEILGKPDRVVTDEYDENEEQLEWNELKLRLTFQLDENDRLTYFTSKNKDLEYNEQKVIGFDIQHVKDRTFSELINEWEIEEFELFQTHFDENNWLTLHSEFGEVCEFQMGVPFKNENEYDWPN